MHSNLQPWQAVKWQQELMKTIGSKVTTMKMASSDKQAVEMTLSMNGKAVGKTKVAKGGASMKQGKVKLNHKTIMNQAKKAVMMVETKVAAVKWMASKAEKTEEGSREESWRD
jgi:hypothetical protein